MVFKLLIETSRYHGNGTGIRVHVTTSEVAELSILKLKASSDILLINFYLAFLPNPLLLSVRRQCPEACVLYTRRLFAQGDSSSNPAHPFSTPIQQPTLGIQVLGK
jgi:hypothetical protein